MIVPIDLSDGSIVSRRFSFHFSTSRCRRRRGRHQTRSTSGLKCIAAIATPVDRLAVRIMLVKQYTIMHKLSIVTGTQLGGMIVRFELGERFAAAIRSVAENEQSGPTAVPA